MQNDKVPERVWISNVWFDPPQEVDKRFKFVATDRWLDDRIQVEYIRADLVDKMKELLEDHYSRAESLEAEKEMLQTNQIPGRCGECVEYCACNGDYGQCDFWATIDAEDFKWPKEVPVDGFCHEWKPKE